MIEVHATAGTFQDRHEVARNLATALTRWEQVPHLALFEEDTAAFVHDLTEDAIASVDGDSNYVRVEVLMPEGVLDRAEQLGLVKELTDIIVDAAGDPAVAERTWVVFTASPEGGWAVAGHADARQDITRACDVTPR